MVGAVIADRWWGKYPTIVWLSPRVLRGPRLPGPVRWQLPGLDAGPGADRGGLGRHQAVRLGPRRRSVRTRATSAKWSGSIRPSTSSSTSARSSRRLLIPWVKGGWGFGVAFAIPGILMGIATIWFWMGRHVFVHVPPKPGGKLGLIDVISGVLLFLTIAFPMFGRGLLPAYAGLRSRANCWSPSLASLAGMGAVQLAPDAVARRWLPGGAGLCAAREADRARTAAARDGRRRATPRGARPLIRSGAAP